MATGCASPRWPNVPARPYSTLIFSTEFLSGLVESSLALSQANAFLAVAMMTEPVRAQRDISARL
eukprot:SAG22_NODE_695_length_7843_cov_2.924587_5_plen_65_part_00